jgi:hypothetical protein
MSIAGSVPRAPRFVVEVPIRLRRLGTESWTHGYTVNMSRSGLLAAAGVSLACDEAIEAVVRLSQLTNTGADVWLRGRVARVEQSDAVPRVATTIDEYRFHSGNGVGTAPGEN